MQIDKDLVAASATPLVLAILSEGESYGYAILKRIRDLSDGELVWTDGMLYPLLHRLHRQGRVTAHWRTSTEGRRRKYYAITEGGRSTLDEQRRQWATVTSALDDVWLKIQTRPPVGRGAMMEGVDALIAEWRGYVSRADVMNGHDVEELEAHLRDQMIELGAVGLAEDEAFLVAVKRLGEVDEISREFALEHSGRLWRQLVVAEDRETGAGDEGFLWALLFSVLAAIAVQVPRLSGVEFSELGPFYLRNAGLLVLPFLAWYFGRKHRLTAGQVLATAAPFLVAALAVNLYPWEPDSSSQLLVGLHLPVGLWFAVALPYTGGAWRSHERRMDFIRFTGEWFIYYVLIALGGGVLLMLTAFILEPAGTEVVEAVIEWAMPSGVAGAVVIAAWLVEEKKSVVENMAPVLTLIFTPLFAVMLAGSAITYAIAGLGSEFDREAIFVLDILLIVVLGLILYRISAREPTQPPSLMDRIQLVAVLSALALDVMVLSTMITRIFDLGFTPNRAAALGLNLMLLVNLVWATWLATRFISGAVPFSRLERWQTAYLPMYASWAAAVVLVLPPLFDFA